MAQRRFYLTKSLFAKACECPRKLAYALLHDVFTQPKTSGGFLTSLAQSGEQIGLYSRLLFQNGIQIPMNQPVEDQLQQTSRWIQDSESNGAFFEGTIRSGPFWIRADVLCKEGSSTLHLFEVKSKSFDSRDATLLSKNGEIKRDFLKYIRDVAFQTYVLKRAFPNLHIRSSLILPDKAAVNTRVPELNNMFQEDPKLGGFFLNESDRTNLIEANEFLVASVNVEEHVETVMESTIKIPGGCDLPFVEFIAGLSEIVEAANESGSDLLLSNIPPPVGRNCASCEYKTAVDDEKKSGFRQCWKEFGNIEESDGLVTDIYSGGVLIDKLVAKGKLTFDALSPDDFGLSSNGQEAKKKKPGLSRKEKQWLQVSKHPKLVLAYDFLESEMSTWEYPLHFIDFETAIPALPYSVNKGPFDLLAFQFSHHTLDEDGNVVHANQFLFTEPGQCPNQHFLEALEDVLKDSKGTVFRWGSYENTVLATLKESEGSDLPPTVESLLLGKDRAMVDLMAIFNRGFYAPGSNASSSIKKLLLPTLRASNKLKRLYSQPTYNGLNFTGMQWWVESPEMSGAPRDPYSLLAEIDTSESSLDVAQGGDAIVAYDKLQKRDTLSPMERNSIEASLRRYCELDTLAMTQMVQGLQDFCENRYDWTDCS